MNAHLAKPIPSGLVYCDRHGIFATPSLSRWNIHRAGPEFARNFELLLKRLARTRRWAASLIAAQKIFCGAQSISDGTRLDRYRVQVSDRACSSRQRVPRLSRGETTSPHWPETRIGSCCSEATVTSFTSPAIGPTCDQTMHGEMDNAIVGKRRGSEGRLPPAAD
jgi:hypothetical protein